MSGYEQEFEGGVRVHTVDATTPDAETECKALGFRNHGLVIRDPGGAIVFQQPDHEVIVDDVHAKLVEMLGAPAG